MSHRVGWGKIKIDAKADQSFNECFLGLSIDCQQMEKWKESVKDCDCWIEDS